MYRPSHQRRTELQRLVDASYEENLVGRIDEKTWREHSNRWKNELGELDSAINDGTGTSKEAFLDRIRAPLELLQTAADQYLTQTAQRTQLGENDLLELHRQRRRSHSS